MRRHENLMMAASGWLGRHWKGGAAIVAVAGAGWYGVSNWREFRTEYAEKRERVLNDAHIIPRALQDDFSGRDEGIYEIVMPMQDGKGNVHCIVEVERTGGVANREYIPHIRFCR